MHAGGCFDADARDGERERRNLIASEEQEQLMLWGGFIYIPMGMGTVDAVFASWQVLFLGN
jgi:hypothetical protein